MAEEKSTWLNGPSIPNDYAGGMAPRWPGEFLGLPKNGAGSLASIMRRVGGIAFDWFICLFLATIIERLWHFAGVSTTTLLLFFVLGVVSVSLFARTPGQSIMRMGVARLDKPGTRVAFWQALVRTLLTVFIFPPVIVDADGRGMHDRATGTAVILG